MPPSPSSSPPDPPSTTTTPLSIPSFTRTQLSLLSTELTAELHETSLALSSSSSSFSHHGSSISPSALSRAGLAISNLVVTSQRTGPGGKTVLDLSLDPAVSGGSGSGNGGNGGNELPEHGIRVGDVVCVRELGSGSAGAGKVRKRDGGSGAGGGAGGGGGKGRGQENALMEGVRGVVVRVQSEGVAVALERSAGEGGVGGSIDDEEGNVPVGRVWIVKLANEVTYKRMNQVMTKMGKMKEQEYSTFLRVLFGMDSPTPVPQDLGDKDGDFTIEWVDGSLNESQKDAIRFALASREVALIHGPPGTGKTHTIIELILQLLKRRLRVLVCGPSNISVDNIVERLAPHKIPMVRLGHPARLLPSVLNHSLDVLTQSSEASAIVKDIRKEMDAKQASIRKTKSGKERRAIYGDLRELRKEYRERERKVVGTLVGSSKVVLATLHGAGGYQLKDEKFDVVIVDEASQALEAQCWVALLPASKVVLAGDHLQLPPTIKSLNSKTKVKADNSEGIIKGMTLETTLFDRLLALHGPAIKRMLTTQYRMHEKIMRFPSDELYESKLIAAEAVKTRLLKDLPYEVQETEDTAESVIFWDTQGGDFPEKSEEEEIGKRAGKGLLGESKSNEMEAALVRLQVRKLVEAGVKPDDIAVITPYNAQLALMSHSLKEAYPGIELGSVDGFQGREKEVVIVSLVRSNAEGEVGFLGEKRRLNVAMTRPKRCLVVVGDSETVSKGSRFLKRWMEFLEEFADLRYPDIMALNDDGGGGGNMGSGGA